MNIQVQLCGLFVLILLFIFYKSHRTLKLYKEKVFYRVMCILIVSLTLDILSLVGIAYKRELPDFFVKFICKSYVVSLIWGSWSAFVYVLTDAFTEKKHKDTTVKLALLTMAESLVVYLLPIRIFADEASAYTYGAAVISVYVFVVIYIISTLIATGIYHKRINPRRRFAVALWMLIWIMSAAIQFLNSSLLIVGFASAVGVLILFVIIENPEANVDRRLGCFNSYALAEYFKQLTERDQHFSVLEISFVHPGMLEENGMDIYELMGKILLLLNQYGNILVFKNINLGLVLMSEDEEALKAAGEEILDRFQNIDSFYKEAVLILTPQAEVFDGMDEMFRFLAYIHTEYEKAAGSTFLVNDEMVTKYKQQHVIEQEIDEALSEDRVEVFLQPIYSNQEHCFTSAEALVRIRKRDGGMLSPGIFIPVAEESGQILQLGERVFEKVCDFLKNSDALKLGIHYIEVNLSVVQCEKKDLAKRLISIIENYHIDPKLINLEITETASIRSRNILLENMKQLIKYGFTFSLDDFGKGESNLMYVVEMPVSIVKLDYDMSKAFFTMPKAPHVVRAVVNMAHGMNLKLVAEGIETKEELDCMCGEGIDYIQGYYYSKPLPMEEFLEFLRKSVIGNESKESKGQVP